MAFTETTSTGLFGRLGGAIKGVIFGLVLFVVGWPVLFFNEKRTVDQTFRIADGEKNAITVTADQLDSGNEGKLVAMNGPTATEDVLKDDTFGVSLNAIKLLRTVEMYQWEEASQTETQKKLGGGEEKVTTYSYSKKWADHLITSADFKDPDRAQYQNPSSMPYSRQEAAAKDVKLQAFNLSDVMIGKMNNSEALPVDANNAKAPEGATFHDRGIYLGKTPGSPTIGDTRITFTRVLPEPVSVLGTQTGNSFKNWSTARGDLTQQLFYGVLTSGEIFQRLRNANSMMAWGLRALGFFLMFFGICLILKPLSVMADVVPFIGNLVGVGTSIVAFLIALPCALIAIAISWVVVRPVLGISLLVLAVGSIVMLIRIKNKKQAEQGLPAAASEG
jgi:hypothetical protein